MFQHPFCSEIDPFLLRVAGEAEERAQASFPCIQDLRRHNFFKVLQAFQAANISENHLKGSSGYGLSDFGREALELIYARVMGAEDALVRPQIVSGTQAISSVLFALTRPGDTLLSLTGMLYPSLRPTLQVLEESGVHILIRDFRETDELSYLDLAETHQVRVFFLQRSAGYEFRSPFRKSQMEKIISNLKKTNPHACIIVDNCYGELVWDAEPTVFGADVICGSLIKNPGGGLALSGGYVAGKKDLILRISERIFAPGLGKELGATEGQLRALFQGLFLAPLVVAEAIKGAFFAAIFFEILGFPVKPTPAEERTDLIQGILLGSREKILAFARGIQRASALDCKATPIPHPLPGYLDEIVMAGGTFVSGSSIELSCDAPMVPPYAVFLQGGLTYEHTLIGCLWAAQELLKQKALP